MIIALLQQIIHIYSLLLIIYALFSWFPQARESKLGQLLARLCEPYLSIFDAILPTIGGVSFNVIVGILVLNLASQGLLVFI